MLRHAATFGSETNAVMREAGECAFPSASLHGAATMLWRMLELGQQRKKIGVKWLTWLVFGNVNRGSMG
jgi:hypothetical protein